MDRLISKLYKINQSVQKFELTIKKYCYLLTWIGFKRGISENILEGFDKDRNPNTLTTLTNDRTLSLLITH